MQLFNVLRPLCCYFPAIFCTSRIYRQAYFRVFQTISLQIYQLAFHADTKLLSRINGVSCNGTGLKKSFTHIEHRAGAVSRECLVQEKIAVPTLLPSKWVRALAPSYSPQRQPERVFTLHQSMAQNLSVMRHSIFEIGDEHLYCVIEISPKSPNPVRFSWRRKSYQVRRRQQE